MDNKVVTVDDVIRFLNWYTTPQGMISTYRGRLAADLYKWIESGFDKELNG